MDAMIGEVRAFPYNFVPRGWIACDGRLLAISQYTALFSLIGTIYGGNGTTTFALPDLQGPQGRTPLGANASHPLGQKAGTHAVTLNISQIPSHKHTLNGGFEPALISKLVTTPSNNTYISNVVSKGTNNIPGRAFSHDKDVTMSPATVAASGNSVPHDNTMPTMVMIHAICNEGVYPSRS